MYNLCAVYIISHESLLVDLTYGIFKGISNWSCEILQSYRNMYVNIQILNSKRFFPGIWRVLSCLRSTKLIKDEQFSAVSNSQIFIYHGITKPLYIVCYRMIHRNLYHFSIDFLNVLESVFRFKIMSTGLIQLIESCQHKYYTKSKKLSFNIYNLFRAVIFTLTFNWPLQFSFGP